MKKVTSIVFALVLGVLIFNLNKAEGASNRLDEISRYIMNEKIFYGYFEFDHQVFLVSGKYPFEWQGDEGGDSRTFAGTRKVCILRLDKATREEVLDTGIFPNDSAASEKYFLVFKDYDGLNCPAEGEARESQRSVMIKIIYDGKTTYFTARRTSTLITDDKVREVFKTVSLKGQVGDSFLFYYPQAKQDKAPPMVLMNEKRTNIKKVSGGKIWLGLSYYGEPTGQAFGYGAARLCAYNNKNPRHKISEKWMNNLTFITSLDKTAVFQMCDTYFILDPKARVNGNISLFSTYNICVIDNSFFKPGFSYMLSTSYQSIYSTFIFR